MSDLQGYKPPPHLCAFLVPQDFVATIKEAAARDKRDFADQLLHWARIGERAERMQSKKDHIRKSKRVK